MFQLHLRKSMMLPFLSSDLKSWVSRLPLGKTVTNMVEDFSFLYERIYQLNICLVKVPQLNRYLCRTKISQENWLLCCNYNSNIKIIRNHLDALKRSLEPFSAKYDNLMVIGDLNAEVNLESMKRFCETYAPKQSYQSTDVLLETRKAFMH